MVKILAILLTSTLLAGAQAFTFKDEAWMRMLSVPPPSGGGGGTPFDWITAYTTGSEFAFNWSIGCRFTVGAANLNVTSVRLWNVFTGGGNTQSHTVKIWDNSGTVIATGSVNLSGALNNSWVSGSIGPVTLTAGGHYTVAADFTSAVDTWSHDDSTIVTTGDATIDFSVFDASGSGFVRPTNDSKAGKEYVGIDLVGTK